ncbi:MAG TPA: glycerol-3-phosphate 1-O-acyltransferase PlsB, partial [Gammaproteobacteria bacterium]|nr:glycerol-3-phosphate 1-O-acyltransferase PlsB [Gammaproteobacteria bacterium]
WNRLYEGIEIRHFDRLHEIAVGSEVIYVPCHRSHVDYMLLSYVIYRRGLASPHIAAGINLNLPLIGPFLRRGGAFFMRRSFRGDALYSAVFRSYLAALLSRGFPIEFFVEGTRSRTGRLLGPKLGLLAMTVETYLRDPRRPIVFVPVYFGYEKLVEAQSFAGELGGKKKQRETLASTLLAMRALRERFGSVDVSFGEPIWLDELLDSSHPNWRRATPEHFFRPPWVERAVAALGQRIMTAINEAAIANSIGLTALVVLSTPKRAIVEAELRAQLGLYLEFSRLAPYSRRAGATHATPEAIVRRCEEMRWLERRPHRLGDVLYMDERRAVLASYHRNNIVHLFALPSLIAASLNNRAYVPVEELRATIRRLYPFFKAELFLRAELRELDAEIDRAIGALAELGLVEREPGRIRRPPEGTAAAAHFMLCGAIVEPFAEHYYLCVIYLLEHGSGELDRGGVVERCADAAEQLAMLYTLSSPDLFEAGLFGTLIDALTTQGLLTEEVDGRLSFGEPLALVADDLGRILRPRVRQTLRLFASAATTPPDGAAGGGATRGGLPSRPRRSDPGSGRSPSGRSCP